VRAVLEGVRRRFPANAQHAGATRGQDRHGKQPHKPARAAHRTSKGAETRMSAFVS
jgi:hypothetical protein